MTTRLAIFLLLAISTLPLSAQVTVNGSLGGQVLDPNGRGVPEAAIALTRDGTNVRSSTVSDAEGRFQFAALPPGRYTASAEKTGFQRLLREGITIELNSIVATKRNSFRDPSLVIFDASLTKRFALTERFGLNVDANFFQSSPARTSARP